MPVVTDLKAQKRRGRVNVDLDGEFAFGVVVETAVKWGLKVGKELSDEEKRQILMEGEFQLAYEKAVRFLGVRLRSEKEVGDWMRRKKLGEELKKMVLVKLKERKLVDDEEFARWWIEQRATFRPRGRRLVERELMGKGVAREVVEKAFRGNEVIKNIGGANKAGVDETELAMRAGEKKLRSLGRFSSKERREKLIGFLQRRGFDWETIRGVVDELAGKS
jgi:regulatory protein